MNHRPLETVNPRQASDAMREEAVRLLLVHMPGAETDVRRIVDCIVSVAMVEIAIVQAEAMKHVATTANP